MTTDEAAQKTVEQLLLEDAARELTAQLAAAGSAITWVDEFQVGPSGLVVGAPTGGAKGTGTINATAVYDDDVLLTDWAFDLYYDGRVRPGDPSYRGGRLFPLIETSQVAESQRRLPWMPTRAEFDNARSLGGMVSRLWFGQEQQQMYIFELEKRIQALEAR